MASPIDTIGKAVRRSMDVRVECRACSHKGSFPAEWLMMKVGAGRDPLRLKFRCSRCQQSKVSALLHDRLAKPEPGQPQPSVTGSSTIAELIQAGDSLYVSCNDPRCTNTAKLDLVALAARLGPDHGIMHHELAHLFKCSVCEAQGRPGRGVGLTHIPNYSAANSERMAAPVTK